MTANDAADAFASPACSLAEVDDSYAGYWTGEEVRRFVDLLLEREEALVALLRDAAPKIRDDALHARLRDAMSAHEQCVELCRSELSKLS